MMDGATALSVSELNEYARKLLAGDPLLRNVEVTGEISGYKHHYSGHRYFSLKDEAARVQCVMFRQQAMGLDFTPADGMRVTVRASASIFPRDGNYQLYVNAMRQSGQGDLYIRFEKLKQKLLAEGLFDPARKRRIPEMPRIIGVVTSETGAALRDIIRIARRRNPNIGIVVSPCTVQGASAVQEITEAIERLNDRSACDVILVGRGGGSLEDLWAFNEEPVARAIAASRIPTISCVGHEVDFTISDFVADLRAPTPSAAAELAVPVLEQLKDELQGMLKRMASALSAAQKTWRTHYDMLCRTTLFVQPDKILIQPRRQMLDHIGERLNKSMEAYTERTHHRLTALDASLRALNPAGVLERGYAVVYKDHGIVSSARSLCQADHVELRFRDGNAQADITSITAERPETTG